VPAMNFYVLIYDQATGRLRDIENYGADRAADALSRRFELDRAYAAESGVEIVLLSAESEAALQRTHARYFRSVDELVSSGA
jgi:hypothetical protein